MEVSVDLETRSALDLKKSGASAYARHASTDVWCMAYSIAGEEPRLWTPGDPPPRFELPLRAWNAPFEREIWDHILVPRYGFAPMPLDQWYCTAAEARAMSLPGGLDQAAKALRLPIEKDDVGARLMMRMARPRKILEDGTLVWWDDEERRRRLYAYCRQDVRVEQAIMRHVRRLTEAERAVWLLDQTINSRGIGIDRPLAEAAVAMAEREAARGGERLAEITGGAVSSVTDNKGLATWLGADSVAKAAVEGMLAEAEPGTAHHDALVLRQEVGKSSVAKFRAMLASACDDDRVRGSLLYHGAGTGRWAGRLIQPQNFPSRGVLEHHVVEQAIPLILAGDDAAIDLIFGPPLQVLSSALRATLVAAPGHELIAADYANIEGRVLAWIAGEEWRIKAFRDFDAGTGPDLYKLSYARAFGVPLDHVDKAMRQLGKVMELALGYQGGVGAFQTMAAGYGVQIEDARAEELKVAWRDASPAIVGWWGALERAAIAAVKHGRGEARGVEFRREGPWLSCRLPSGRKLWYREPEIRTEITPWGKEREVLYAWGVDSYTKQWRRYSLYGGLLAENVVQAIARDVMAGGMMRVERAGYPVILTVHDEVVSEIPAGFGSLEEYTHLLTKLARWAHGLPIAAKGWRGRRYRK